MAREAPDARQFCGGDRLQITRLRRSENPSAVTAKTPENGLEITADIEQPSGDDGYVPRDCCRPRSPASRDISRPRRGHSGGVPGRRAGCGRTAGACAGKTSRSVMSVRLQAAGNRRRRGARPLQTVPACLIRTTSPKRSAGTQLEGTPDRGTRTKIPTIPHN